MAKKKSNTPTFHNRKAKHEYDILDTLEVGISLEGTEVKALRDGDCSIAEGYILVKEQPVGMTLHGVTIGPYPPAGFAQHIQTRLQAIHLSVGELPLLCRFIEPCTRFPQASVGGFKR